MGDFESYIASVVTLTHQTKSPRLKRRVVFLFILGSCYTTFDAKLFEDAVKV